MGRRRILETTGFITIAAALHVSAAALMTADPAGPGVAAEDLAPSALAAGGPEMQAMVEAWETPPDLPDAPPAATAPPDLQPVAAPRAAPATDISAAVAIQPDAPNLPAPPDAAPDPVVAKPAPITSAALDLPPLTLPAPPNLAAALTLQQSARPVPRPKPNRAQRPEPTRQAAQPRPAATAEQAAPRSSAGQVAGQGGQARANAPGGGGGGPGPQQQASLMAQWGGQIRSCINRRATPPRDLRQGGRVVLALTVGRDGTIQGAGIAASSGQSALDRAALGAAQRAGRCPAAPAGLDQPRYAFQLPITLDLR